MAASGQKRTPANALLHEGEPPFAATGRQYRLIKVKTRPEIICVCPHLCGAASGVHPLKRRSGDASTHGRRSLVGADLNLDASVQMLNHCLVDSALE